MPVKSWKTENDYYIYRVLSGRSNAYLIARDNVHILVDNGMESAYPKLTAAIRSLPLSKTSIDYAVLTHTHFDHCQNTAILQKTNNCKVITGMKEKVSAETGIGTLPWGTTFPTKLISKLGKHINPKFYSFKPFIPEITVSQHYSFKEIGSNIQIIATPGHSVGSVSVIVDDSIALVGDTLFGVFPNSVFPPYADDPITLVQSWATLLDTACQLFLPGHGGEIKRALLEKAVNKRPN